MQFLQYSLMFVEESLSSRLDLSKLFLRPDFDQGFRSFAWIMHKSLHGFIGFIQIIQHLHEQ